MSSFLLTWNPRTWNWTELPALLRKSRAGKTVEVAWRCRNKSARPGDTVFLLHQGKEPRGIMGSGTVLRGPYQDKPDDPRRVDARLSELFDPHHEGVLPLSALQNGVLRDIHWATQSSGIIIPEEAAAKLLAQWRRFLRSKGRLVSNSEAAAKITSLNSTGTSSPLYEGAVKAVVLNKYERRPKARALCIAHYGARCVVCDMNFEDRYGKTMAGFIHVHHVTPISAIRKSYRVDPIRDLRPVCPNCHAVIHSRGRTMSVARARSLIAAAAKR